MQVSIDNIDYICRPVKRSKRAAESIRPIGIDTEAYTSGKCFMAATSEGDVWPYADWPQCLFNRKYIDRHYVAYNLKYDESALLQWLTMEELEILRVDGVVKSGPYTVRCISKKMLNIKRGTHAVHIWDMYNFYRGSLEYNASTYLNKHKTESDVKSYTPEYVKLHWDDIAKYCVNDAVLVKELAQLLIRKFEELGVHPRKLFSTAYISYQYFSAKCKYVTVKRYWDNDRKVLDFAVRSYNGGKFEVTQKGPGYYYEYDIVSAYPAEIANLADISYARIVWDNHYRRYAVYGFIDCIIDMPATVNNPCPVMLRGVCLYPFGRIRRVITKTEYEYLTRLNVDIQIVEAVWLHVDEKIYPYRKEINNLVALKHQYKAAEDDLNYHTVKILMNSLYGKFCQLIENHGRLKASTCWNPIYASVITANVRTRITEYQNMHPEVVAVHTDSIITTSKIDVLTTGALGEMIFESEGPGVIVGCGVYQIGGKSKFRGYSTKIPLIEMLQHHKSSILVPEVRPLSWREVAFRGMDHSAINFFDDVSKELKAASDIKRMWIDDYKYMDEISQRNVMSEPLFTLSLPGFRL